MSRPLPEFVALGEALTDLIRADGDRWVARSGGSTWNVARAAATLGLHSAFAGAVSVCCFGDALWSASADAGLDLRFAQRVERSPLLAIVPQSHPPSYFFVGDDSADLHFDALALPAGWMAHARWAHFGGISLAREPLASRLLALAASLHAQGVAISYDLNFRRAVDRACLLRGFEHLCRLAAVIKLSDEDLQGLMPDTEPAMALARVHALNPEAWLLFTEGARGARLITPQGRWHADAPPILPVDTLGAGDAAMAGLVASRAREPEASAAQHLAFAVAAGSAACLHAGAHPPALSTVLALRDGLHVRPL
ncbi:PfkB family carbohydrate kinase [Pelomonas sp. CA6]|uniref:PfkB family carbohydrate kinase n=1 Tax=Pelomonas sp. CA6 TaxID=2907999 RepID=UPI001F4C421F|nr:PfkB family carbohydrate kinase [Pelomonas sp. CA6]MCH7345249.1 PfkB family carbohydrate kinase [Pelomonas sp. CA6]